MPDRVKEKKFVKTPVIDEEMFGANSILDWDTCPCPNLTSDSDKVRRFPGFLSLPGSDMSTVMVSLLKRPRF